MFTLTNKEKSSGIWEDITCEHYKTVKKAKLEFWKMVRMYIKIKPSYAFEVQLQNTTGKVIERIEKY